MPQTTTQVSVGEATKKQWADTVYNDMVTLFSTAGVIPLLLSGMNLSNNSVDSVNDIDISPGACTDLGANFIAVLSATLTKQIDAVWAEGDDVGGMFSGSVAIDTWYHLIIIRKDADGTIDAGMDTDEGGANTPVGWTSIRRIGSILTDGGSKIRPFDQTGPNFTFYKPITDYDNTGIAVNTWVTVSCSVPNLTARDIEVMGTAVGEISSGTLSNISLLMAPVGGTFYSGIANAMAGFETGGTPHDTVVGNFQVPVDSSGQMIWKIKANVTTPVFNAKVTTLGWYDRRGV